MGAKITLIATDSLLLRDTLPEIGMALRGGESAAHALSFAFQRAGHSVESWTVDFMSAAMNRDYFRLKSLLKRRPSAKREEDIATLAYIIIWTLYWVEGPKYALEALTEFPDVGFASLPLRWQNNISYLAAHRNFESLHQSIDISRSLARLPYCEGSALPIIKLTMNGTLGRFLLDTGAPTTVISETFAKRARITQASGETRQTLDGGGHSVSLAVGFVHEIAWIGISVRNSIVDITHLNPALKVDGIVSPLSLWLNHIIVFDDPSQSLMITSASSEYASQLILPCHHHCNIVWVEGHPYTLVDLNGQQNFYFLIDSGAGAILVSSKLACVLSGSLAPTLRSEFKSETAIGSVAVLKGSDATLLINGATPENINYLIKDPPLHDDLLYPSMTDGYLGLPWFKGRRVCFVADRKTILFSERNNTG